MNWNAAIVNGEVDEMSALEEYRNQPSWRDKYYTEIVPKHAADAAIAELETKVDKLQGSHSDHHIKEDGLLDKIDALEEQKEQAEAALATSIRQTQESQRQRDRAEAERNDIAGLLNAADKQNHFLKAANEQAEAEVARLRKLFGMAEEGTK